MRRVLCVWFPNWPIQRHCQAEAGLRDKPLTLIGRRGRLNVVTALSPAARRFGVDLGMPRAEVQASAPQVELRNEDQRADHERLLELAVEAERFSPIVGVAEGPHPTALLLDITGCSACFGGEEPLVRAAAADFAAKGWHVRLAVAATLGAAWAVATTTTSHYCLIPSTDHGAWLAPLPVAALRLPAKLIGLLQRLGLTQIGQLRELPRVELPARFGPLLTQRLAQAWGDLPEPIVPHRPLPLLTAKHSFEEAVENREFLLRVITILLASLATELRRRCRGARKLVCELRSLAPPPHVLEVAFRQPTVAAERLGELVRIHLEGVRLAHPVTAVQIRITQDEALLAEQGDLFACGSPAQPHAWNALVEGLSARFGRMAVCRPILHHDPQPERIIHWHAAIEEPGASKAIEARGSATSHRTAKEVVNPDWSRKIFQYRPLRLWPQPIPVAVLALSPPGFPRLLRLPDATQPLVLSWGPERIETGWWRGEDLSRDYFIVETARGARLWLFRRGTDGAWFWHGCFD